ncbi:ABC transporter ATP-binding protein [Streptomyces globosus]|uniref:ABC transporter ATP-binding protein n=1 Tax=Streptomyces globosus TaxID=68209 RepID=UPI0038036F63
MTSQLPRAAGLGEGPEHVLEVAGLKVAYAGVEAVAGISFSVAPGEIFGLLGRNGAGKTSTISAIAGLRRPDAGRVRVLGEDALSRPEVLRASLALQPQQASLFPRLKVRETLETWAALYPAPRDVDALLDEIGLAGKAGARASRLSGGQQQRLLLATALVGDTPVVVLDEPTTGLDPHARHAVWDLIRRAQAGGTTFLLTTHAMAEAEEMCDRLAVMHEGRMVAAGSPAELIARYAPGGVVSVRTSLAGLADRVRERFGAAVTAAESTGRSGRMRFEVTSDEPYAAAEWITGMDGAADVRPRPATLEDVFLRITGTTPEPGPEQEEEQ